MAVEGLRRPGREDDTEIGRPGDAETPGEGISGQLAAGRRRKPEDGGQMAVDRKRKAQGVDGRSALNDKHLADAGRNE